MCIACLSRHQQYIDAEMDDIKETLQSVSCIGCKDHYGFMLTMLVKLRILCSTKIKIQIVTDETQKTKLTNLADKLFNEIKQGLNETSEYLFENKEETHENEYLTKMNELKDLHTALDNLLVASER
jgi:cell shape-determining protein MreC